MSIASTLARAHEILILERNNEKIGKIKEEIDIPVIALGGINENNVSSVLENGADGIAVISAILQSEDPRQSATELYKEIKKNESKSEKRILTGREDAAIN